MTMTPTLHTFIQALQTPEISFTTLTDARPVTETGGIPPLMRTTRFAEAEIIWRGRRWLLSLPLSPAALAAVERTASQAGRLNTEWLTEYRILRGELCWVDPTDHPQSCDLVLQHLPAGRSFAEALLTEPAGRLLEGLDALQSALRELGFTLVSAVHPDAHRERDVLVGAGNLIFADASLAAGCRTGTGCVLRAGARLEAGCRLEDHVHLGEGAHLGEGVIVEEGAHLGREVRVDAGLRLEKNIFVPDNVHLTHRTLPLFSAGGEREGSA